MPDGFTHVTLAHKAADLAGYKVLDNAAFAAGANGPDIFFSFEGWKSAANRRYPMKELGNQMHTDCTGAFLRALCKHAKTQTQLDYFMGFVAHYAIDTTVHPFVTAVTKKGQPYHGKQGHGYFEIALDSYVCKTYTGKRDFGIDAFAPKLTGTPLAEIVGQLDRALTETYSVDLPFEYIMDAIEHNRAIRSIFSSPLGIKRCLFWLVEPLFGGRGVLTTHVHPRRLKGVLPKEITKGKGLPNPWTDPVTGERHDESIDALLTRATAHTAALYKTLQNHDTVDAFWAQLGSFDYVTGTETEASGKNTLQKMQD